MRVLVVGAGAVGGYFGGRLVEKGANVTFLVRQRRKEELEEKGLIIRSVHGDAELHVQTLTPGEKSSPFDLIILSVKAYHLENALASIQPYIGDETTILPLLNGIGHLDLIKKAFGNEKLIGGLCFIETTLNRSGEIEQYSSIHDVVFGELNGERTDRIEKIERLFAGSNMGARSSRHILTDMWKKYVFISAMSGMTSLMRSPIGPILSSPHGKETYGRLLEEIVSIARMQEPSLPANLAEVVIQQMEQLAPTMKSSMLRDMEKGLPIETEHLHGTLLQLAPAGTDLPLLKTIYGALSIYQQTVSA